MKIVMISTWPPRFCGIATYSDELVTALRSFGHDVEIICHIDGGRNGETQVHPVIDMTRADWYLPVQETIQDIAPDVVHWQHEYGIYSILLEDQMFSYGPDRSFSIAQALFHLNINEIPTVVTYHSVFSKLRRNERLYMDVMTNLAGANILHEPYQAQALGGNLGRETPNVFVVAHGAPIFESALQVKDKYGLGGKRVVGVMGWWEPNKGMDRVISWWPAIKEALGEDAVLLVAGDARPGSPTGLEAKPMILKAVQDCPVRDSIEVIMGAFSPREFSEILSCIDLLVLPYSEASQSGNLAHAYGLGVPAVVSAIEGLESSIIDSQAGVAVNGTDRDYIETIISIMEDEDRRLRLSENALAYVRNKISWEKTVEKHVAIYRWAIDNVGR